MRRNIKPTGFPIYSHGADDLTPESLLQGRRIITLQPRIRFWVVAFTGCVFDKRYNFLTQPGKELLYHRSCQTRLIVVQVGVVKILLESKAAGLFLFQS